MIMKFSLAFCVYLLVLHNAAFGQSLFESDLAETTNQAPVSVNRASSVSTPIPKPILLPVTEKEKSETSSYLNADVGDLLVFGIVELAYQISQDAQWDWVYKGGVNIFNLDNRKNDLSAEIGGKLYLDKKYEGPFIQGFAGIAMDNEAFSTTMTLGAGYEYRFNDRWHGEVGISMYRSFADDEGFFTVLIAMGYRFDQQVFPFL